MSITLIMTWDIKELKEQEYFEFVVSEWIPATNRLGLQTVAAWLTQYRKDESVPLIRAEAIAEDRATMRDILHSDDWHDLHERLLEFVENYQQKVVNTTGEFKI